jgi:histidinol-phosphate aminotransferase
VEQRDKLATRLKDIPGVIHIYPSDANFLLVRVEEPRRLYEYLVTEGIIVRDRSRVTLCEGCLRVTVGTPGENEILLKAVAAFSGKS